jgi:hypothetical protein
MLTTRHLAPKVTAAKLCRTRPPYLQGKVLLGSYEETEDSAPSEGTLAPRIGTEHTDRHESRLNRGTLWCPGVRLGDLMRS